MIKRRVISFLSKVGGCPPNIAKFRAKAALGLRADRNSKATFELKDKHANQRAFVIGSGPSLRMSDLDMIKNEISLSANKIYLAFPKTEWRPTYHFIESPTVADTCKNVLSEFRYQVFSSFEVAEKYALPSDAILYTRDWHTNPNWPAFQFSPIGHVFSGYTTLYSCLQYALFMGISEVYLLGVDQNYSPGKVIGKTSGNTKIYSNAGERNHFSSDYHQEGGMWTDPDLKFQQAAFRAALKAFESKGRKMFNATRGGNLEDVPRVDFDSLF